MKLSMSCFSNSGKCSNPYNRVFLNNRDNMMKLTRLAVLCTLFTPAVFAAPLTIDTYNPQEKGIFAVSSTLVYGPKEAVLFDAQFSVKDGEALVEKIRRSGKTLNKIVITSGDPDFYFGERESSGNAAGGGPHQRDQRGKTAVLGSANERRRANGAVCAAGAGFYHLYGGW
jgi:hypothetical protein